MRRTALFLLTVLLLTSCVPARVATPAPSATALPTATPAPTLTPTATPTPTPTPTPIPTLPPEQLGGLQSVPDPRVTHPELFDLTRSDAPIPQFVNAMEMAGISVPPEEVAANLQYQPITGVDGLGVYAMYPVEPGEPFFDENTPSHQGFVLLRATQSPDGEWKWKKPELDEMFRSAGINYTGALMDAADSYPTILKEFNLEVIPTDWEVSIRDEINWRFGIVDKNNLFFYIGYPANHPPDYYFNLSSQEKEELFRNKAGYFTRYVRKYGNRILGVFIGNELHETRVLLNELIGMTKIMREIYPNVKLIYNDTDNHYRKGVWTHYTQNVVSTLGDLIDVVGVQMHLAQWPYQVNQLPTRNDIATTLQAYGKEVWVTEFDITTKYLKGNSQQKATKQAEIAYEHTRGILDSGVVTLINFWGLTDNETWYNTFDNPERKLADALLFDREGKPKLLYYTVQKAIIDHLLSQQSQ